MVKITEQKEKGAKTFFKLPELVGQPFEIVEDVNALSDFREAESKDGKTVYACISVTAMGETKDVHLTASQIRQLRNVMPPAIATWKGQRLVLSNLASGYSPCKFTRLMGDYAMPPGQQQIGQQAQSPIPAAVPTQDPVSLILAALRAPGIHDSRIGDLFAKVEPDAQKATFLWGMLKYSGKVMQRPDGCWVST